MRRLFMLLAMLVLAASGCAGRTSAEPSLPTASPVAGCVDISLTFTHRSGIASNQFAVWIEDSDGKYIKTLYVTRFTADGGWKTRSEAIPTWVEKSGLSAGDVTAADVRSGATPKSGPLTYVWDCTDADGKTVPDGDYRFVVEGTIFWKDAVTYSGVINIGTQEAAAQAEVTYTTEDAKGKEMISDVTAVYTPE